MQNKVKYVLQGHAILTEYIKAISLSHVFPLLGHQGCFPTIIKSMRIFFNYHPYYEYLYIISRHKTKILECKIKYKTNSDTCICMFLSNYQLLLTV